MHLLLPRIYALGSERHPTGPPVPQLPSPGGSISSYPVAAATQSWPVQSFKPCKTAPLPFPGSQQQASLWPAFHVHIPVPAVGAIGSWQVAGKEAFGSLLAAASFSLPRVARRTENCLYPSCSEKIKPISPALAVRLYSPS